MVIAHNLKKKTNVKWKYVIPPHLADWPWWCWQKSDRDNCVLQQTSSSPNTGKNKRASSEANTNTNTPSSPSTGKNKRASSEAQANTRCKGLKALSPTDVLGCSCHTRTTTSQQLVDIEDSDNYSDSDSDSDNYSDSENYSDSDSENYLLHTDAETLYLHCIIYIVIYIIIYIASLLHFTLMPKQFTGIISCCHCCILFI